MERLLSWFKSFVSSDGYTPKFQRSERGAVERAQRGVCPSPGSGTELFCFTKWRSVADDENLRYKSARRYSLGNAFTLHVSSSDELRARSTPAATEIPASFGKQFGIAVSS